MRALTLLVLCTLILCFSRAQSENSLADYVQTFNDLEDGTFTTLLSSKIPESQFILIGESHGIVEAGALTKKVYQLAQDSEFSYLCIETDPLAAQTIQSFYANGQGVDKARKLEKKYPFSIPFYNNHEDYLLFDEVINSGGQLWGIDQSLMSQFRLNFDHLIRHTDNPKLKELLQPQLQEAVASYRAAVSNKDFMQAYLFKYNAEIHNALLAEAQTEKEKDVLNDLWKSKEIYEYQFQGKYYLNNNTRGRLMKSNFMQHYNQALSKEKMPKVVFKLGYNHAARGLTFTRIYDIGNMASELAISNGLRSLNIAVMAVSGFENRANPIETQNTKQPVDYGKYIPKEFIEQAKELAKKFVVINTEDMRPKSHQFSESVRELIFKFDLFVLVNDARPLTSFE